MAFSIGDYFPLPGSRRQARLRQEREERRARQRGLGRARASALQFETFEPRLLLSADVLGGVTLNDYLANPTIGPAVLADLTQAINLLDNVAGAAEGDAPFDELLDTAIPGLLERETQRNGSPIFTPAEFYAPTLRDVLQDNGADPVNFGAFLADTLSGLAFVAGGTAAALDAELDGLSWTDGTVTVTLDTVSDFELAAVGGDNYEYRFDLRLTIDILDASDSAHLDLGRQADAIELAYGAASILSGGTTPVAIKSSYQVDALAVVAATLVEDTYDHDGDGGEADPTPEIPRLTIDTTASVLRDPSFAAGVSAQGTLAAFGSAANAALKFGFLDISAGAASIDLAMAIEAQFDGDFATAGDLNSADLGNDDIGPGASSHVDISLPVSVVDVAGFPAFANAIDDSAATVVLSAPTPFDALFQPVTTADPGDKEDPRTSLQIRLDGFGDLDPFRNIDADGMANVVSGLAQMLEQLQNKAELFGRQLPFLDGQTISKLLDFDGPVRDLYNAITTEVNGARVAKFSTVQGFVGELVTALASFGVDVNDVSPTFTTDRASGIPTLLFNLNISTTPLSEALDVDGDLGVGLGPLGDLAVTGSLDVETQFDIDITLGIEMASDPVVTVASAAGPFAMTALAAPNLVIGPTGAKLRVLIGGYSVDGEATLEGGGAIAVTVAPGSYATVGDLADALRSAIQSALAAAVLPTTLIQVGVVDGRLTLSSESLPVLQVVNGDDDLDPDEFEKLGFSDLQRASTSRLPADGVLSGPASFTLRIGGEFFDVDVAPDAGNRTLDADGNLDTAASVAQLAADVNTAINTAFSTSDVTYVTLSGDIVSGLRLTIDDGNPNTQAFVGIDGTNDVARRELGLVNDAIASRIAVRGESGLAIGPNDAGDAIGSPDLGSFSFDVRLIVDGTPIDRTVTVEAADNAGGGAEAEARRLAADINAALDQVVLDAGTGQTLASVLNATAVAFLDADNVATGDWGIRLSQPAATLDSTLAWAVADRIEISNVSGDGIGLADGGVDRLGPTLNSPLAGDASFTINLVSATGVTTPLAITVPGATATLSAVVDAINDQIEGSVLDDQVVAGLDGTRLVLALASGSATILSVSNVNAVAQNDLGLSEGISARSFSGVDAFIQDVNLRAAISATGSASGSANFGFVGLDLGQATAEISAVADLDFAVGETDAIFISQVYKALQKPAFLQDPDGPGGAPAPINPDGILGLLEGSDAGTGVLGLVDPDPGNEPNAATAGEEVDVYGSAKIRWEGASISIAGSADIVTDLENELADAVGDPFIEVAIPNLTNLDPSTFLVSYDLGGIADAFSNLADFGFDDAIAALRAIAQWLKSYVDDLGILNQDLPLLGVSLADSLDFVDDFAQAIEDIAANPTKNLQGLLDKVNEGLQQFAGAVASLGYVSNSPGVLTFNVDFSRQFADNLPLNIDVVQLLTDAGVPLDFLPEGAVELSGQADLAAAFGIDASLTFGIDVDALSAALDKPAQLLSEVQSAIFLDADDTFLELSAYAAAENVTFTGSLGPLGLFVTNGGAVLNGSGAFGDTTPATIRVELPQDGIGSDDRITLAEFFGSPGEIFSTDNIEFALYVAAVLPVYFPSSSNFIGNLAFSGHVTDPFNPATGIDFTLDSLPDFSQIDFGDLGILDTLNLFLAGADTVLGTLGGLIDGQIFGGEGLQGLPLVGDALSDVGAFIDDIRNGVIPVISNIIDTAPELIGDIFYDVGASIQGVLDDLPFLVGANLLLNLVDGSDNVLAFDFASDTWDQSWIDAVLGARAFSFEFGLDVHLDIATPDVDLGIDVFALEFEEVHVLIDLGLAFGMGVSLDDGFFFQVKPQGEDDLTATITVDMPEEIKAELFLLQLTATEDQPSYLSGNFGVDVLGTDDVGSTGRIYFGDLGNLEFDVEYGIDVLLDLDLALGLNEDLTGIFGFPEIQADFGFEWHFGDDDGETTTPELTLANLKLDIGSFLGETIGPFIRDVYEVIEPIDPILDILTDPIPVLSDLLGPTSLLDVAAQFGFANPALVTALELLDQLVDFASTISDDSNGFLPILDGPLTFGGDGGVDLTDMNQVGGLIDPTKALTDVLDGIGDLFGADVPDEITDALTFITSGINQGDLKDKVGGAEGGFSFPFLDHPEEILGLFFGRNMTLVAYDLPPLEFGFDFSIYVPIWGPLGARFAGGIGAVIDLAFGYDTQGFFEFANGGFRNPLNLFDGFFVYDDNPFAGLAGVDVPEVTVTGEITAAAELNAVVASAGVGGGIFATIGFDLVDPDQDLRIRLEEILANLYLALEEGPLALFTVDALIEAKLFAYVEALFGLWRKEFQFGPSIPLYEEHFELVPDPVLATDMGDGTLRLNVGKYAGDRVYTTNGADEPSDVAETLEVEIVDADTIRVRGYGDDFNDGGSFIDWQEYNTDFAGGFTLILGDAGQGDDSIVILDPNNILTKAELRGGAGNDRLEGGGGADLIRGDTGEDHLIGGGGADRLDGGAGADCLEGGDGNDTLAGGAADDVLIGGEGDDVLLGEAGDDTLAGQAGADVAMGGAGRDLISGGAGADILQGEGDIDRIWGDAEFSFVDCVLTLDATGDEPALTIPAIGDHGADHISGGGGSDEIQGNGGDDLIYGDSSFKLEADFTLSPLVNGKLQMLLPLFGDFGADNLSGGAGADTIFGEAGNDVIRGDNTRVIKASDDDDDPRSWVEGDRFDRGTAQTDGADDGNDVLSGGKGSDIVFGNAGDDTIAGGVDNDFLLGNAGNDTVTGELGSDVIFGDSGVIQLYVAGDAVVGGTYSAPTQDLRLLRAQAEAGDGDDVLDGGLDADFLFGGDGSGAAVQDTVSAGAADDVAYGDHGEIQFSYVKAAGASFATTLTSVDRDFGGHDLIYGSTGRDVLVGGKGDDQVLGDGAFVPEDSDSRDIVAGDHVVMTQQVLVVKINALDPDASLATQLSDVLADVYVAFPEQVASNEDDPSQGGDDTLDGRQDDDFIIGGPGADEGTGGRGNDVLVGDRGRIDFDLSFVDATDPGFAAGFGRGDLFVLQTVQSTDLNPATDIPFTGIDRLSGGDGNDVVIGGGRGDFLFGDAELDGSVGVLTADSDIVLGDNGRVDYLQHGGLATVRTTDTSDTTGGDDQIEGNAGIDIAMGGVGADLVHGDAVLPKSNDGDDILLGDNGEVDFTRDLGADLVPTGASPANLATLDLIVSYTDGLGGIDTISGDAGGDVAMGGTDGDFVFGDSAGASAGASDGDDILLGDNGRVELVDPALDGGPDTGADRYLVRGGAVALIRSTDEPGLGPDALGSADTGGRDEVSGNAGGDIVIGGVLGDWLYGDQLVITALSNARDGDDILLGDNGALEWLSTGRLDELSFDPSDPRWNAALPLAFAVRDVDLDTLDLVTTEQPNNGGRDLLVGGNGRDAAFGGTDADTLYGDSGSESDGIDATGNANDLLFGDHGRLYMQLGLLPDIHSRNFFAIDIGQGSGGEGDRIWGEEGMDILLGQQGDDRLWGGSGDDDLIGGHNVQGGADELTVTTLSITTGTDAWNDLMDGGSENDTLAGDNAVMWRTGLETSPRFRTLVGATLYTTTEDTVTTNVDGTDRQDPDDTRGRFVYLLDHADTTPAGLFGRDVMAGGAQRDALFGQLGDDLMQGDGTIDGQLPGSEIARLMTVADTVVGPDSTAGTHWFRVPERLDDADDYLEGNGGGDTMYGGLGQDDMIGGSSSLFGLTTAALRPDGSDRMWGGAGLRTARGDLGGLDGASVGSAAESAIARERGRDADHMLGDNGDVFRIVALVDAGQPGGETVYRRYQYDNSGYTGDQPLVVRASAWLDYTLGGADYDRDTTTAAIDTTQGDDNGAGDLMFGEAGNDHVHGMAGSDILFGDAHDDDIVGGYGHDWISGGTGQDGVIGDDGIIRTSRNSTAGESLFGVAGLLANDPSNKDNNGNVLDEVISTPGNIQRAVINVSGELTKAMDLTPLSVDARWGGVDDEFGYAGLSAQGGAPFADDVVYGGTGSDWLHGGSGDDAMSGAEALPLFYERARTGTPGATTLDASSVNAGDQLRFNPEDVDGSGPNRERAGEFALYDEYFPRDEIRVANPAGWGSAGERVRPGTPGFAGATPFFLNFDATEGVERASETVPTNGNNTIVTGIVHDDGADRIFGDGGNDWIVGGTGRDNAYGGWGNDLINVDDDHRTNGSLNDQPETHSTFEDRAYGGAGRDVLIGNTGGDRLIDWVGEWNAYLVPFAPFGMATVSRTLQPQLPEFLYALSRADGADPTIVADGNGTADRNGEPQGELGLVLQKDDAWQDQTGAPSDPQAGNIPGGTRDVLRSADFNNQQGQGFVPESGSWTIANGRYEVAPEAGAANRDAISLYFTGEPVPTYFEVAAKINAVKATAGFKANAYVIFDYVSPTDFKFAGLNVSTNKIEIGQRASWGFQALASINAQLKAGQDYNVLLSVNGSAVTFVVNNAHSVSYAFAPRVDAEGISHPIRDGMIGLGGDNARARIDDVRLQILPPNFTYRATDEFTQAGGLLNPTSGQWQLAGGRWVASAAAGTLALADNGIAVGANAALMLETRLRLQTGDALGGLVFDKYSDTDFKWVALSAATKQVLIGHFDARTGWVVDQAVSRTSLAAGVDYTLALTLKGSTVSVTVDGAAVLSRAYNATVVDGAVGALARGTGASFDRFVIQTDDVRLGSGTAAAGAATVGAGPSSYRVEAVDTTAPATITPVQAVAPAEARKAVASPAAGEGRAWWRDATPLVQGAETERSGSPLAALRATAGVEIDRVDGAPVARAPVAAAEPEAAAPAIDWQAWQGVAADSVGGPDWQELFVSRLAARAQPGRSNATLWFQL